MGFSDTLKSIGGNLSDGISGLFSLGSDTHPYPASIGNSGTASLKVTNIPPFNDRAWQDSLGYSFKVVRVTEESISDVEGWKEFRLQINPQELTQDEIFAIEVTPTFRGVLVEHHGITLKDITIGGTTGISPGRKEGGAFSQTGAPIFSAGQSGYKEFHELRSYFRVYVETKRVDDRSKGGELRMVFKNYKDQESLFVEPQKFTMKRSAQKPLMYDYQIQLKAIGVATFSPPAGDIFQAIIDVIDTVSDGLNDAANIITGGIAFIERTERDVTTTILGPLTALNNFLDAFKAGQESNFSISGFTRRFIKNLTDEVTRVEVNINETLGRDVASYNAAAGRTSTLTGTAGRVSTFQELQILNAFGKIRRNLRSLSAQDTIFIGDSNADNRVVEDSYGGKIQIPDSNSVRTVRVLGGDTIQSLAAREMGNPDSFRDIVILNNLRPPYIDTVATNGVLTFGDEILIPQSSASSSLGVRKIKEFQITRFLSETEKNLGVDLRLDESGDIAVGNTSDLDLIAGITNMSQALALRIELEKGSLKRHPEVGTRVSTGQRATSRTIVDLRDDLSSSIGSDPRVEAIPFIEASQSGGTTSLNMLIKLRNLNQPIPIPLTLQTG